VATDSEGWEGFGVGDGFVERVGCGHQCGGSEGAGAVQFHDRRVHSLGQSKVICVHDQAAHSGQCISGGQISWSKAGVRAIAC